MKIWDLVKPNQAEIKYSLPDPALLRSVLDRQGTPFRVQTIAARIDITECLDPASKEGNLLLDFLTQLLSMNLLN